MLIFPICSNAQDKALDVQIQYNGNTKDLVFTLTNKVKNEILFINDGGTRQGSLFSVRLFDVKEKCIFNLDYVYRKNKNEYQKRFIIEPGETITCTYNVADLIKNMSTPTEHIKILEIESWLVYGELEEQKKLIYDKLKKSFDY